MRRSQKVKSTLIFKHLGFVALLTLGLSSCEKNEINPENNLENDSPPQEQTSEKPPVEPSGGPW